MENQIINIKASQFENDLNECLTIIAKVNDIYTCELVTPALYVRIVNLRVVEGC
jgi:hypothetical protein